MVNTVTAVRPYLNSIVVSSCPWEIEAEGKSQEEQCKICRHMAVLMVFLPSTSAYHRWASTPSWNHRHNHYRGSTLLHTHSPSSWGNVLRPPSDRPVIPYHTSCNRTGRLPRKYANVGLGEIYYCTMWVTHSTGTERKSWESLLNFPVKSLYLGIELKEKTHSKNWLKENWTT